MRRALAALAALLTAVGVWTMSNNLPTSSEIAAEALRRLKNTGAFLMTVDRQYEKEYARGGTKKGVTINIRKPVYVNGRRGAKAKPEGIDQRLIPFTINTQYGADIAITSQEEALNLQDYGEQVIQPAIDRIVNDIEVDGLLLAAKEVSQFVGTPASVPTDSDIYGQAAAMLSDMGVPRGGDRYAVLNPTMTQKLNNALKGQFNPQSDVSKQNRTGEIGKLLGLTFLEDQNVPSHTIGALGGTPLVNGAGQTGSSIITDGWSNSITGVVKKGDILTFAGVNSTNPSSRVDTGNLSMHVVTADVDSDGSGNATIPIYPPISPSALDPYRTVTASPANNAVIKVFGHASNYAGLSTRQGLVYWNKFITFANVDLYLPKRSVEMAAKQSSPEMNLSIRHIRYYTGNDDELVDRFDVLGGWKVTRPEAAVRVCA